MADNFIEIKASSGMLVRFTKHRHLLMIHTDDISMQFELFQLRYALDPTGKVSLTALRLHNMNDYEFHMTWYVNADDALKLDAWLKKGVIPDDADYQEWKNSQ